MIEAIASVGVVLVAIYLFGLALLSIFTPAYVCRLLKVFASSAPAHYAEMLLRFMAGCSFVVAAPNMLYSEVFLVFGWVLLVSTLVLLLLPWRWHQRFAQAVVPSITLRVRPFGIVALALGGIILWAVCAAQ